MAEGLVNMTRLDDPADVIRETQGRPTSPGDEVRIVDDEGREVAPGEVGEIVVDSQAAAIGKFEMGPNADAWFPELQDQWGKAVAGDQTLEQALRNVQDFITKDLDEKGISYTIG
jgi:multiple sugar transport system substrate-binding protein